MSFGRKILKVVGDMPDEGEPQEFVDGAASLLLAAVAALPEAEREAYLADIEGGGLRRSVAQFLAAQRFGLPQIGNGNGAHL